MFGVRMEKYAFAIRETAPEVTWQMSHRRQHTSQGTMWTDSNKNLTKGEVWMTAAVRRKKCIFCKVITVWHNLNSGKKHIWHWFRCQIPWPVQLLSQSLNIDVPYRLFFHLKKKSQFQFWSVMVAKVFKYLHLYVFYFCLNVKMLWWWSFFSCLFQIWPTF